MKNINEKLEKQLNEDREKIVEAYEDLRSRIINTQDYAVHGMTLSKFAELLMKQTGQILELAKLEAKNNKSDDSDTSFSEEELEDLTEHIENIDKRAKKWG